MRLRDVDSDSTDNDVFNRHLISLGETLTTLAARIDQSSENKQLEEQKIQLKI